MATTKTISPEVLQVLRNATVDGKKLQLTQQLDRRTYEDTAKIIEMLGGKWNRSAKCHLFAEDAGDRIAEAIMTGAVTDLKQLYQFFETPDELAFRMVKIAGGGIFKCPVLEPSAGHGAIASKIEFAQPLTLVELDPAKCAKLEKDYDRAFVRCTDFLSFKGDGPVKEYGAIIMNPPFSKGQDIAHIRHAYDLLAKGGRLVAIASPAWQYRTGKWEEFRLWLAEVGAAVEDLAPGTFKVSGTGIATTLLTIDK